MPKLSGVYNDVGDGALGSVPASIENDMVVFGVSQTGTVNTVFSCTDKNAAIKYLGMGPLTQAAVYLMGAGAIKVVPVGSDISGAYGEVRSSNHGSHTVTLARAPVDNYSVVIVTGETRPGNVTMFKYSLNGGATFSKPVPASFMIIPGLGSPDIIRYSSFLIPDTGIEFTFETEETAGIPREITFTFECTAPSFSTPMLNAAVKAFLATPYQASLFCIVDTPTSAADTASRIVAVQTMLTTAESQKRYIRAIVEAADDDTPLLLSATSNTEAKRVVCCAGFVNLFSEMDGMVYRRSAAWPVARRAIATRCNVHVGRVKDGTLSGIQSLDHDERSTPDLCNDEARFCTLRTYVETPGFFVEDDFTMAKPGSDFAQLRNGRVMDKALRIADQFLVQLVHDDFALEANGTIAEHEALRIEAYVGQGIRNGIVAAGNASASEFTINRFEDMAATRTIRCKTRIQVRPDAKWIEHDIAFTRALSE